MMINDIDMTPYPGMYKHAYMLKQAGTTADAWGYHASQMLDGTMLGSLANKVLNFIPFTKKHQSLSSRITGKSAEDWANQYHQHAVERWGEAEGNRKTKNLRRAGVVSNLVGMGAETALAALLTGGVGGLAGLGRAGMAGLRGVGAAQKAVKGVNLLNRAGAALKAGKTFATTARAANGGKALTALGKIGDAYGRFLSGPGGSKLLNNRVGYLAANFGKGALASAALGLPTASILRNINNAKANGDDSQRSMVLDLASDLAEDSWKYNGVFKGWEAMKDLRHIGKYNKLLQAGKVPGGLNLSMGLGQASNAVAKVGQVPGQAQRLTNAMFYHANDWGKTAIRSASGSGDMSKKIYDSVQKLMTENPKLSQHDAWALVMSKTPGAQAAFNLMPKGQQALTGVHASTALGAGKWTTPEFAQAAADFMPGSKWLASKSPALNGKYNYIGQGLAGFVLPFEALGVAEDVSNIGASNNPQYLNGQGASMLTAPLRWMGWDRQARYDAVDDNQTRRTMINKLRTSPSFRRQYAAENGLSPDMSLEDLEAHVSRSIDRDRAAAYYQERAMRTLGLSGNESEDEVAARWQSLTPEQRSELKAHAYKRLNSAHRYGALEDAMTNEDITAADKNKLLEKALRGNSGLFDMTKDSVMAAGHKNRALEDAMAARAMSGLSEGGQQDVDPTVLKHLTQSALSRAGRDGNYASDFMASAQLNNKGVSMMPLEMKRKIADELSNLNPYTMFRTMDNEHLAQTMKFVGSSEGNTFLNTLPPERRMLLTQQFARAGKQRVLQAVKEDPLRNAPMAVGAWLRSKNSPELVSQLAENPVTFYTTLLGMVGALGYGGYKLWTMDNKRAPEGRQLLSNRTYRKLYA